MTFVDLFVTGCATTPALHVIGVYEAQTPPSIDDGPWWAKCVDDEKSKKSGAVRTPLSRVEVVALIRDAIEFHIEGLRRAGDNVPEPASQGEVFDVQAA
jgi:hypothetical protein